MPAPLGNKFSLKTITSEQKYWKEQIRKSLSQVQYWFTSTNGLLKQYLENFGHSYKSYNRENLPLSFSLTLKSLNFLHSIFNLPQKFTKYVMNEEIVVFYIRTHQVNFTRLYNKNKKYLSTNVEANRVHHVNSTKLAKAHLKCLFALAKNRSDEMRGKFNSFSIVHFIV